MRLAGVSSKTWLGLNKLCLPRGILAMPSPTMIHIRKHEVSIASRGAVVNAANALPPVT